MSTIQDTLYSALVSSGCLKPNRKTESFPATYAIIHSESNRAYVGSTDNYYRRMTQHATNLRRNTHPNKHLQDAYNQSPNLEFRYSKAASKEDALKLEQVLIDTLLPSGKLFNISPDARVANKDVRLTEQQKEHIRQQTLRQFENPEAKEKHRLAISELWNDPTYRQKQTGHIYTAERKNKIGRSVKQNWTNPVYRQNVLNKQRKFSLILNGVEYPSRAEAARALGIPVTTLHSRLSRGYYNGKAER